jgi:hypothetical protein
MVKIHADICSQVEDYGRRIPPDPTGKKRERHRILQESTGNSRKWKQYSRRKFIGFFPLDSGQIPVLSGRNRSEIIRFGRSEWTSWPLSRATHTYDTSYLIV